jgi:DNA-binding NarL/FixJ family response regulator
MHSDLVHVNAAFEAGANGYILKSSASTELTNAIQTVMNGQRYLTPVLKEG